MSAQDSEGESPVQIISGRIFQDERHQFLLPDLKEGDVFYGSMSNVSGNLDPLLLLTTPDAYSEEVVEMMRAELARRVQAGDDRVQAMHEILQANFLAGNDNFAANSTAAFEFKVPASGDYLLLALSTLTNLTEGEYELVAGINAPQVLEGSGRDTGDVIAVHNREASGINTAVHEIRGELSADQHTWFYTIPHLEIGDTLYAYIEATSGDLIPILSLEDYSGRILREANFKGSKRSAAFEYPITSLTDNYRIIVNAFGAGEQQTAGEYRLLLGTNEETVLSGEAQPAGRELVTGAKPVTIFVELQQITGVDQKAENYGAVYYLQMDWHDPEHAFNPDECKCRVKSFTGPGFNKLISDENFLWPNFTLFNQQNNRWTQNQGILVAANGDMRYFERFTTTFQAPDFNFRAFPFDTQQFYIRVDSLYPRTYYEFIGPAELSQVGDQLGEEEWQLTGYTTEVSSVPGLGIVPSSRFSFGFQAHRLLNFYILRIFLPTLLIIVVSYFTFFLKDYSKRIDVASANLLVFVAFNFTISGELPRLGYLTFIDAMLASVFIVTGLVVAFNVFLKRLEITGHNHLAQRIDSYTLWVYPLLYAVGAVVLYVYFLLPELWNAAVTDFNMTFGL